MIESPPRHDPATCAACLHRAATLVPATPSMADEARRLLPEMLVSLANDPSSGLPFVEVREPGPPGRVIGLDGARFEGAARDLLVDVVHAAFARPRASTEAERQLDACAHAIHDHLKGAIITRAFALSDALVIGFGDAENPHRIGQVRIGTREGPEGGPGWHVATWTKTWEFPNDDGAEPTRRVLASGTLPRNVPGGR